jgi:hypothetical protein
LLSAHPPQSFSIVGDGTLPTRDIGSDFLFFGTFGYNMVTPIVGRYPATSRSTDLCAKERVERLIAEIIAHVISQVSKKRKSAPIQWGFQYTHYYKGEKHHE